MYDRFKKGCILLPFHYLIHEPNLNRNKGNKVLNSLNFPLIAASKWSFLKQWKFFRKCVEFILLFSKYGKSVKIKDFGISKKFVGIMYSSKWSMY